MFHPSHLQDFAFQFLAVLFEGLPYIFVGTLISGFIDVYLPAGVIDRFLPKKKWLSILVCGLMGLILPVCECTVVPVIRRLVAKGLPVGSAFAYMLAAPIVNPITFFSTWTAFEAESMSMALSRMAIGYLVAVTVGLIILFIPMEKILRKAVLARLNFSGLGHSNANVALAGAAGAVSSAGNYDGCCSGHTHDDADSCDHSHSDQQQNGKSADLEDCCSSKKQSSGCCDSGHDHKHEEAHEHSHETDSCCGHSHDHSQDKLVGALRTAVKDFMDVSVYFTIGVMLMIIFNTAASQGGFLSYVTQDGREVEATMFMMGLSFVLSLCSTSDAFLVATNFDNFGRISKMAFLVYGPMMDVKLIFLYQTLMKTKAVLIMGVGLFILVGALCMVWGNVLDDIMVWWDSCMTLIGLAKEEAA